MSPPVGLATTAAVLFHEILDRDSRKVVTGLCRRRGRTQPPFMSKEGVGCSARFACHLLSRDEGTQKCSVHQGVVHVASGSNVANWAATMDVSGPRSFW